MFIYIVLALAGNKNDMYEHEEVEETEGAELGKELGAIFQKTSAKEATGVDDLFIKIGKKFLNPADNGETQETASTPTKNVKQEKKIKLENVKGPVQQKSKCC